MAKNTKLELTWIGKDKRPRLEPRVLIEDPTKSYHAAVRHGDKDIFDNMLIHGDNLLALKALEQQFAGKVKCIYIDPPFNTGAAFDNYDDGIEHSIWLNLMRERFMILHTLLNSSGAIFVHLDDNEADYCKVLLDEIFGRENFINRITVDARSPSAFSVVNPGLFVASEYILYYAKNRSELEEANLRVPREVDYAYNRWIENFEQEHTNWRLVPVVEAYKRKFHRVAESPIRGLRDYDKFILENAERICRLTAISDTGAGHKVLEAKRESLLQKDTIIRVNRENLEPVYVLNGQQIAFYKKNVVFIAGQLKASSKGTDIWTDIAWEGIAGEGGVKFKKGKKPERLIERCIGLVSRPGDIVLDSFLGSGTTAAVAHKMGRRWIGIELGDQCYTHCKVRLDHVVNGEDQTGISESVGWKGGGGYRFYELAPTLIKEDAFGQKVINKEYNAEMLAEAVCKLEGFTYAPSETEYFIHGHSTERDFIYVTTNYMTTKHLVALNERVGGERSLLVCCKGFTKGEAKVPNLTVKKIPKAVLDKCEYGHDDYSLNVKNLPMAEKPLEQGELFD